MTKTTIATLKSFIKKNQGKLYIKKKSSFDGMTDCVEAIEGSRFVPISATERQPSSTLGIQGVWIVGSSGNLVDRYEDDQFVGLDVYNCCGTFIVAIEKAA
jgi:hypothetical protein